MVQSGRFNRVFITTCGFLLLTSSAAHAAIKDLSRLRELANTKVTTVSKTPEDPFDSAAAVYVITREDIRRSGATTIPEILRMAPGLDVARAGSSAWAVGSRGFNDTTQNKLLILIDGRVAYSPVFPGVRWDTQDVMIEDIKQIEVIRGPGAAVWGTNAVNGVINIITEEAENTLENFTSVTQGVDQHSVAARHGGKIGDNFFYRTYAKYDDYGPSKQLYSKSNVRDGWQKMQTGFRADWEKSAQDTFNFQGDIYKGAIDRLTTLPTISSPYSQTVIDDNNVVGGNLSTKWTHIHRNGVTTQVQAYIDHFERNFDVSKERVTSFDVDVQHFLNPMGRHSITVGEEYRLVAQRQPYRFYITYNPTSRTDNLFTGFLQDKITIFPDLLSVTFGTKVEHNDYTGFEYQPSARFAWTPTKEKTIWGAVSRVVRTPSRAEYDLTQRASGVVHDSGYIALVAQDGFKSEDMVAYELGYRARPNKDFFWDSTIFYNDYNKLRTLERGTAFSDIAVPLVDYNYGKAESYGTEWSATWDVNNMWQLSGAYTFLTIDTHVNQGSTDTILKQDEGKAPKNQFNIRSNLTLPHDVEFDNALYYVDSLSDPGIPPYFKLDSRLAWKPLDTVELSVVGQNLLDSYHREFRASSLFQQSEIGRTVYGKVSVRF